MSMNPIGLVIIGIAALIGLVAVAIRYWDKWGAALMIAFGPLGMIIAMVKALYDNWELVKQSFSEGGIISGIKTIGAVVLSGLLYPVQQLLELISNIPGIGGYAGSAAASVKGFREGLVAPNQSAVAANNNNVNVNISNRNVESKASVTPKYGAVITGNLGLSGAMP
jgi:hypothetical protein